MELHNKHSKQFFGGVVNIRAHRSLHDEESPNLPILVTKLFSGIGYFVQGQYYVWNLMYPIT